MATNSFHVGVNVPWNHCGNDYAVDFNSTFFDEAFSRYSGAGASMARVWLMYNTNKSLQMYDEETQYFLPLTQGFLNDVESMLDLASKHNILIVASLLSFECADYQPCRNMMESEIAREYFINGAIIPLSTSFSNHPALYSWEIFNEPEWMMVNSNLSLSDAQSFHKRVSTAFHATSPSSVVSTGSASWKWSSSSSDNDDEHQPVGDWWESLGMDFYSIHFYSWMTTDGNDFDAFSAGYTPSYYHKTDQRVMIGEAPGSAVVIKQTVYSTCDLYKAAYDNGYSGLLLWSDAATDGVGDWADIEQGMKCFSDYYLKKSQT